MATTTQYPTAPIPARHRKAQLAALLTVVLWASAFVGIRSAGRGLAPGPLALTRLVLGSAALGVVMLVRREPLVRRPGVAGVVVCGVMWLAAYNVLLNAAERRVDAGTAALLVNIAPVFIALLAAVTLRERLTRRLLAGCAISLAGVGLIALGTSHHGLSASLGTALCIAAAAVYAVGVIAQKPALRYGSALSVTWLACTIGAVLCLPFAPSLARQLGHANASTLPWPVYLGLVPTAVGFSTWAYALASTDAGRLGSMTYLVPPISVLLAWLALGETPPLLALLGGILCIAGVAITRLTPRRPAAVRPAHPDDDHGDRTPAPASPWQATSSSERAGR
jgi:drug/metabolite transporter (DMT)-like permease